MIQMSANCWLEECRARWLGRRRKARLLGCDERSIGGTETWMRLAVVKGIALLVVVEMVSGARGFPDSGE
jgi:hypothetical protein